MHQYVSLINGFTPCTFQKCFPVTPQSMQDESSPHSALPVRVWFNNRFITRWIESPEPTEWRPQSPDLTYVIYLCAFGPNSKYTCQNQTTRWNETTILRYFTAVPIDFSRKVASLCFPCLRSMCPVLGPMVVKGLYTGAWIVAISILSQYSHLTFYRHVYLIYQYLVPAEFFEQS
jgi:hypothetical protein